MMQRKSYIAACAAGIAAVGLGVAGVAGVATNAASGPAPASCPGKIVCPLNGEVVCRDQCPRVDPARADCPGRIECPATGELICADRCPLETADRSGSQSGATAPVPPCCAKGSDL